MPLNAEPAPKEEEKVEELLLGPSKDIKVRRGLGILEELIKEKSPNYFKEQIARKQALQPLGLRVSAIAKRLAS
jgi:hypothetical protein